MKLLLIAAFAALAALAAGEDVFHHLSPVTLHSSVALHPALISQPALWHHAPSTYSSSLVEKYHHAPVFSDISLAPHHHHYVEKIEKIHHHVPLVLAHHPALTTYSAVPVKPASYHYVEKLHHTAAAATPYTATYSGPQPRILQQTQDMDPAAGAYRFNYATENGIQASEQATLKGVGPEGPISAKEGVYSYTGPDGVLYTVNWVADENGYRAAGDHLPQVPEEIKRSLEFNAQHHYIEDARK